MSNYADLIERLEDCAQHNRDLDRDPLASILTEADACIREMVEWRPIETAPRDGTEIVGFDRRTGTGHVTSADQWGDWVDPDNHYYSEAEPFQPTHWLPLPPAPGAEDE